MKKFLVLVLVCMWLAIVVESVYILSGKPKSDIVTIPPTSAVKPPVITEEPWIATVISSRNNKTYGIVYSVHATVEEAGKKGITAVSADRIVYLFATSANTRYLTRSIASDGELVYRVESSPYDFENNQVYLFEWIAKENATGSGAFKVWAVMRQK